MSGSRVVCGVGVPHVPVFPSLVAAGGGDLRQRYAAMHAALAQCDPSLLVVVANDHLNAFFLDRLPTLAIDLGDTTRGPVDQVPGVESAPIRTDPAAATVLAEALLDQGYDLTRCRELHVDHSVVVPLHFLNPTALPVVIVYINAYVPPLPTAARCHALGAALAAAVTALPGGHRVAVVASGSFSQEVGGFLVDEGRTWSVPRPDWAMRVSQALAAGDVAGILGAASPAMLSAAGTVSGELLSWIAMVGAVGAGSGGLTTSVDYRPGEAFAFGSWVRE